MNSSPSQVAAKPDNRVKALRAVMRSPSSYVLFGLNKEHRPYQDAPTEAIINSILNHYGDSIVIIFPRQSGKNELQAQLET